MASPIEILVPDIGGFKDVNVIDVLVKDGQQIEKETPLVTIETEKAAMDVPSPSAGKIAQVKLKSGDKVSQGSLILLLEDGGEKTQEPAAKPADKTDADKAPAKSDSTPAKAAEPVKSASSRAAPARVDEAAFSTAYA